MIFTDFLQLLYFLKVYSACIKTLLIVHSANIIQKYNSNIISKHMLRLIFNHSAFMISEYLISLWNNHSKQSKIKVLFN